MVNDSDVLPLHEQPRIRTPRPWRRYIETIFIVGSLFFGGVGTGMVLGLNYNEAALMRERQDRIAEIDRLQRAYDIRINSIAGRVAEAADTAAGAAQQAGQAATTAQTAAQTAKQAASIPKEKR